MKQHSLKKTELVSFVIASALGVLFHFMYEWTGENAIAGLFFPINESIWEHLKLIFFPVFLLALIEYFILDIRYENFLFIKFLSVLLGMAVTIILFYTYTGIYGKNNDVLNILIYICFHGVRLPLQLPLDSFPENVCRSRESRLLGICDFDASIFPVHPVSTRNRSIPITCVIPVK